MSATHVVTRILSLEHVNVIVAYLLALDLRSLAGLRAQKAADGGLRIEHLSVYSGYRYLICPHNSPIRSGGGDGVLK